MTIFLASSCKDTLKVSDGNLDGTGVNSNPRIQAIANQRTGISTPTSAISVVVSDEDSTLSCTTSLSMSTSDQAKVLDTSVQWGGTAPNCTAIITPETNASGDVNISFRVSDGSNFSEKSFTLSLETKELDASWTPHYASLDAYWRFKGTPGTSIADGTTITAAPIGESLTYNNPMNLTFPNSGYTSAPTNQGVLLSENFLTGAGPYAYPTNENFTIMTWIKFSTTTEWRKIISNAHSASGQIGFSIQVNPIDSAVNYPGSFVIALGAAGDQLNYAVVVRTTGSYNDDQWHHLVAVFDQISKRINVYVDGEPVSIVKQSGTCGSIVLLTTVDFSSCPLVENFASAWVEATISGWAGTSWQALDNRAALSEIAIFNAALSAANVETIYDRQK